MPRPGTRSAGIFSRVRRPAGPVLAVFLSLGGAAGCSALEPVPGAAASPSPAASAAAAPNAAPSWVENLSFTGDVRGTLNQITPGDDTMRSACTGRRGQGSSTWVLTIFGAVARGTYGLQVRIDDYRGPGRYAAPQAGIQVFRPDNSAGWRASGGDPVTFTVGPDQQSGDLQATMTNLANDQSKLRVNGNWTCVT